MIPIRELLSRIRRDKDFGQIGSIIASLKLLDDFDRPLINRHLT